MEVTRRGWGVVALGVALAVMAWVIQRPLLLGATAGIFVWLLARQWWFVRSVDRTRRALSIRQTPDRDRVTAEDTVTVALTATTSRPAALAVTITSAVPAGATGASEQAVRATIDPHDSSAETTFPVRFPVAGQHSFGPPQLAFADDAGLFRTTTTGSPGPTVTVEPQAPGRIHVGAGGDQLGAFGAHRTGQVGEGIETAELREYVTGDPADRIDWKATARLNTPHVREYEVETDLQTALVVDCRGALADGPAGRTKLAYLKEVALAYLAGLERNGEAVGLYAVGDEGILTRIDPDSTVGHYERLRRQLVDLDPTDAAGTTPAGRSPGGARQAARALADDETDFGRTLRPFFADSGTYVERVSTDPLYRTVNAELSSLQGPVVTAVLSDDSRPAELRETVKAARRGDSDVVAFLTPSVLFEADTMGDLERAYARYSDFERFRRDLSNQSRVTAYEVAPEGRIEAVLNAGRRRNSQSQSQ